MTADQPDQMPDVMYVDSEPNDDDPRNAYSEQQAKDFGYFRVTKYIRADLSTPPKSQGVEVVGDRPEKDKINPYFFWTDIKKGRIDQGAMKDYVIITREDALKIQEATRQHPDKRVEGLVEALEFIANGCLVPPDGGSPNHPEDCMGAANKALRSFRSKE